MKISSKMQARAMDFNGKEQESSLTIYQNILILLFLTFGFLFPFFFLSFFFFFWNCFRNKSDFVVQHTGILTTG